MALLGKLIVIILILKTIDFWSSLAAQWVSQRRKLAIITGLQKALYLKYENTCIISLLKTIYKEPPTNFKLCHFAF